MVDAEKARIVSKIFADFLNNKDINMICDNLNSAKIKTSKGNNWDCRAVEYILQNPVYIGKIRWNPICKTGRDFYNENLIISNGIHEPIVDEVIFEQTRRILFLQRIISKKNIPINKPKSDTLFKILSSVQTATQPSFRLKIIFSNAPPTFTATAIHRTA